VIRTNDLLTTGSHSPLPNQSITEKPLSGGGGDDRLQGENGNDVIHGGSHNDSLMGGAGDDTLNGDGGDDTLHGAEGADTLDGAAGQDVLVGGDGDDELFGGTQDDVLVGGAGADQLNGGLDNDRIQYDLSSFSNSQGDLPSGGQGVDAIEIVGTEGDDHIEMRRVSPGSYSITAYQNGKVVARHLIPLAPRAEDRDIETIRISGLGGDDTLDATGESDLYEAATPLATRPVMRAIERPNVGERVSARRAPLRGLLHEQVARQPPPVRGEASPPSWSADILRRRVGRCTILVTQPTALRGHSADHRKTLKA
jgi:Ca2+-binding RTX toxin-like protein